MNKRLSMFFALLFIFAASFAARADVIVEPQNDFYSRHADEIIYLGRSFEANGSSGAVEVKSEPGSFRNMDVLKNGETAYMEYSCLYNGEYWGFAPSCSGWVKLDEMLVLYDYVAFVEEHGEELYTYSGDYARIEETASAVAWPWPGADSYLYFMEDLDMDSLRVLFAYEDEHGREWGFVQYLYGSRNIWFCLSDPQNRDLPALHGAPPPSVWVSDTEHTDIIGRGGAFPVLAVIVALVAALAVGTAVLIRVLWKTDKTKTKVAEDEND